MNILHELNEKQKQAVTHQDGPLLVIAGPGTGKTRVITQRIAYLIRQHSVKPAQILAITFTNKAAQEMQERVNREIGAPHGANVKVSTFHAFCVGALRKHANAIGMSDNFAIFDQEIQDELFAEVVRELQLDPYEYPPWMLCNIISNTKGRLGTAEFRNEDGTPIADATQLADIRNVAQAYQHKLDAYNALDFDDLLAKTVALLEQAPAVQKTYHQDIRHILVDEYHDVNGVQYRLLQLLCAPPAQNLMVVADEDQAIYSWRGSNPQYITDFTADFAPRVIHLDEHYRCSEKILRAAEEVISKNAERQNRHTLKTHEGVGRDIFHYSFITQVEEAQRIIQIIRQLIAQRNYSYRDIAIFYRQHKLANVLEEQLTKENIEYQRIQPTHSFQEEHAKAIVAYLSFAQWQIPRDLELAISFPEKRIDDLTWVRLKWLAQREGIQLVELLKNVEAYPEDVGPLTRRNVKQFWTQLDELMAEIEDERPAKIVQKLFDMLERSRSPYSEEEIAGLEISPVDANLDIARDVLYSALDGNERIQITAAYGIDAYCAAHIIRQTLESYLAQPVHVQFLPVGETSTSQQMSTEGTGVHLFIGELAVDANSAARTILIGNATAKDDSVVQLQTDGALSITALALCQRLIGRFENPNMADMVVYDLETTGVNPKNAQIVEIGAHRLSAIGDEVERFYRLVKPPGGYIPRESTRVHGIDEATVRDAPSIETVLPEFCEFIRDRILIGHNVTKFDNPILERDLRTYLKTELRNPFYDTLVTARRLFPRARCNIKALADRFGIPHGRLHSALDDIAANREIFKVLIQLDARKREITSLTELLPFVGLGILAQNSVSDTDATHASLNAAKRYVQTHGAPEQLIALFPWEPAEEEQLGELLAALKHGSVPTSQEDTAWQRRRIQMMNAAQRFEGMSEEHQLVNFLDYQKLLTASDERDETSEKLTLMTLHSAKGTEFPVVFIIGMEEGSFPMWQQNMTEAEIEEERRLFYVGMTRAQQQLYLTTTVYRFDDREHAASMFVREIPSNYLEKWTSQSQYFR